MGFVKQVGQGLGLINNDAPSAQETLDMQQKANNQQLQTNLTQNRVNQVGPDGSSTWSQGPANADGSPGTWTQTTSLSPGNQKLYDTQMGISQGLAGATGSALDRVTASLANPLNLSGLPDRANAPDASNYQTALSSYVPGKAASVGPAALANGASAGVSQSIQRTFDQSGVRDLPGTIDDASRKRVEEAIMSRINPQYQNDESMLRNRLLNSGIEVGTDAYNREMNNFSQRLNDARMQAVLAGGQEESRQVGLTAGLNAQEFQQALDTGKFAQTADTNMAGNQTASNIASANNATQASIAAAAAQNQMEMFKASQANDMTKFNTTAGFQMAGLNNDINSTNYRTGLAGAQFQNDARSTGLQEELALRQQPLNELNALRSGSQVQTPTFGNYYTNGMNPGNAQAATNESTSQANTQQGQFGNFLGKVGSFFL